jgi:hypothetical protein
MNLELLVGLEDGGHEKVQQGPQLGEAVLQGRACQQQAAAAREAQKRLPTTALEVLDVVGLVQNEVAPALAPENEIVLRESAQGISTNEARMNWKAPTKHHGFAYLHCKIVARDANVKAVWLGPALALHPSFLDRPVVREHLERRAPLLELHLQLASGNKRHRTSQLSITLVGTMIKCGPQLFSSQAWLSSNVARRGTK